MFSNFMFQKCYDIKEIEIITNFRNSDIIFDIMTGHSCFSSIIVDIETANRFSPWDVIYYYSKKTCSSATDLEVNAALDILAFDLFECDISVCICGSAECSCESNIFNTHLPGLILQALIIKTLKEDIEDRLKYTTIDILVNISDYEYNKSWECLARKVLDIKYTVDKIT